jgi:hypothetical protein
MWLARWLFLRSRRYGWTESPQAHFVLLARFSLPPPVAFLQHGASFAQEPSGFRGGTLLQARLGQCAHGTRRIHADVRDLREQIELSTKRLLGLDVASGAIQRLAAKMMGDCNEVWRGWVIGRDRGERLVRLRDRLGDTALLDERPRQHGSDMRRVRLAGLRQAPMQIESLARDLLRILEPALRDSK